MNRAVGLITLSIATRIAWRSSGRSIVARECVRVNALGYFAPAICYEQRFPALMAAWKSDEGVSASLSERFAHPADQQIIALGPQAVPRLLAELEREPDWWFAALKAITGADSVPPPGRGRLHEMAWAWLDWARASRGLRTA